MTLLVSSQGCHSKRGALYKHKLSSSHSTKCTILISPISSLSYQGWSCPKVGREHVRDRTHSNFWLHAPPPSRLSVSAHLTSGAGVGTFDSAAGKLAWIAPQLSGRMPRDSRNISIDQITRGQCGTGICVHIACRPPNGLGGHIWPHIFNLSGLANLMLSSLQLPLFQECCRKEKAKYHPLTSLASKKG